MDQVDVNEVWAKAHADLEPRFGVTEVNQAQAEAMANFSHQLLHIATFLAVITPPSRELSTALTALEEAKMFAIAAISRHPLNEYSVPADEEGNDDHDDGAPADAPDPAIHGLTVLPGGLLN